MDTPAAPTPLSAPTVAAAQVTASGAPVAAVYRFDVSGATFQLPNPYADQIVVPPLIVQGFDGTSWIELGALVPAMAPTIVAQGSGFVLQLGAATFWWENPSGQPAYQQIRVGFGSSGPFSSVDGVTLADLPAPSVLTNSGPQISAARGPAAPVDTGIDQAPLSVQVLSTNSDGGSGPALPFDDPSYQRIYYRENLAGTLITNLFPTGPGADLSTFIGVSPYAGAYPNNGSAGGGGQSTTFDGFHYVATTSTIDQDILGYLANDSNPPLTSQLIDVHGTQIAPVNNNNNSPAAGGLTVPGCADFSTGACRLAAITTNPTNGGLVPAMYLNTTSGIQIGLLTNLQATTAVGSLPLQHAPGTNPHLLESAPLTVSTETSATFGGTVPFVSGDSVDTYLVTHGILVPISDVAF